MVSKNQVLKLIDSYAPLFIQLLKIEHCSIYWHVYHSKSKELNKYGFSSNGCVAMCLYNNKKKYNRTYDIAIYYDLQKGKKDAIGSILHELLHVRFRQWDRLIKPNKINRAHVIEEQMVSHIEQIIIALI